MFCFVNGKKTGIANMARKCGLLGFRRYVIEDFGLLR
jgi:hypothetical protein